MEAVLVLGNSTEVSLVFNQNVFIPSIAIVM